MHIGRYVHLTRANLKKKHWQPVRSSSVIGIITIPTQLVGDLLNVSAGIWVVLVVLEKIVDAFAQHVECEAHEAVEVEPVQQVDAT